MTHSAGDRVLAYTTVPEEVCEGVRPIRGVLLGFYQYGEDRHWHVRDEDSRHGSVGEYKEQWLRPNTHTGG